MLIISHKLNQKIKLYCNSYLGNLTIHYCHYTPLGRKCNRHGRNVSALTLDLECNLALLAIYL